MPIDWFTAVEASSESRRFSVDRRSTPQNSARGTFTISDVSTVEAAPLLRMK